jgi:methyl-accepting chemotaxis protein
MRDITAAADGMRAQSEQTARALVDLAKTLRGMITDAQNTAKQIKLITKANLEHSTAASSLLTAVSDIRAITDRNATGVKQTRGGTDDLLRRAQALSALVEGRRNGRNANGRHGRSSK